MPQETFTSRICKESLIPWLLTSPTSKDFSELGFENCNPKSNHLLSRRLFHQNRKNDQYDVGHGGATSDRKHVVMHNEQFPTKTRNGIEG